MNLDDHLRANLAGLEASNLRRKLHVLEEHLVSFSSNDYLGLRHHPSLKEAATNALIHYGSGAGASRLVGGNSLLQHELEESLALFKNVEAALTFSSGYTTALGVIPALVGKGDWVILDKKCHACLIDGARLSEATMRVFPHNDLNYLENLLRKKATETRALILTESVFSMDGDLAPLPDLVALKERYGAWLLVDEAHGTGVFGSHRRGCIEAQGMEGQVEVQMGTLSKAFGCTGGYICGSHTLIDFLVNQARSLIFSTAPTPLVIAVALASVALVKGQEGEIRQQQLWRNVERFSHASQMKATSSIFPVIYGEEGRALAAAKHLKEQGFYAPAIRYPTVPRDKARLRVTINSNHDEADIDRLGMALGKMGNPASDISND